MERCGHWFDGIRFFASVLRFPGYRLVFPRIEDLRRQWHRGDAQSPFRTWKLSPVAAMVLRSEGRGRVARCRITRQGGVGLGSTGSTPPSFYCCSCFSRPTPKKTKQKTNFCVTADETISFFPCLALVLLTTANNALSHRLGTDPTWRSRSRFLEDDALEVVAYGAEPARQRQPTRSEPDLA